MVKVFCYRLPKIFTIHYQNKTAYVFVTVVNSIINITKSFCHTLPKHFLVYGKKYCIGVSKNEEKENQMC